MKRLNFILLIITILVSFTCNEDVSDKGHDIYLKNITLFPCSENLKLSNSDDSEKYIKCFALDNKTLKFEQKLFVNCCSENFKININSEDNSITINITNDDPEQCNCICSIVLSYEIANLRENHTYKFIFLRNDQEYHIHELLFTGQINGEVIM